MNFVEPIRNIEKIELLKKILKKNSRNFLLFIMGINTGLRISDILKLKVSDVFEKEYIEIKEQKTGKAKKFPITTAFRAILREYIKDKAPECWLFESRRKNKSISRVQAYRIINSACKKAGIKDKTGTHTLRKTFGYHFYRKTKDIALLQTILNHSNLSITKKYIGINQDLIDISMERFCL